MLYEEEESSTLRKRDPRFVGKPIIIEDDEDEGSLGYSKAVCKIWHNDCSKCVRLGCDKRRKAWKRSKQEKD
jgi:hypothetical protein